MGEPVKQQPREKNVIDEKTENSYKRRKTVPHWDFSEFSAFIRTQKIAVQCFHYQLLDDIKQNHEIISVFMGKILCLHILQVRDLFLPQKTSKRYRQKV